MRNILDATEKEDSRSFFFFEGGGGWWPSLRRNKNDSAGLILRDCVSLVNLFPNKPCFLRVCSASFLKTIGELSANFVACKLF